MTDPNTDDGRWRKRLVDQALSMHSKLRDRAARTSTIITVTLLCATVVSTAFAFAGGDSDITLFGLEASRSTWLGVLSVALFCGTLAELITDRRGVARNHEAAVRLLFDLKSDYRQVEAAGDWSAAQARLAQRYDHVMEQVPPIPESIFNKLKAEHLKKVEVSKLLSEYPGISVEQAELRLQQRLNP